MERFAWVVRLYGSLKTVRWIGAANANGCWQRLMSRSKWMPLSAERAASGRRFADAD
jgi:hypothetical protein